MVAGHRLRYFTAADLVETLYRGLADNSVGRVIDNLLRVDFVVVDEIGFAPLDATGSQLFFRFFVSAYERVSLGIASHWPFEQWGRFLPEHTTTVSMLDRLLHHAVVVVTEGESFRMREARSRGGAPPKAVTGLGARVSQVREGRYRASTAASAPRLSGPAAQLAAAPADFSSAANADFSMALDKHPR